MKSKSLKSSVLPVLKPVSKLIGYGQTPQVTGLEYKEVRDYQKKITSHPDKADYYLAQMELKVTARQMYDRGII